MKPKYLLIFIFLFGFNQYSHAQKDIKENLIVFFSPQYMITNAMRFDIDIRQGETNKWWVVSPYFYFDNSSTSILNPDEEFENSYDPHTYEEMWGLGLELRRKMFLLNRNFDKGFYLSFGANYKYFDITGDNVIYIEEEGDDGLIYTRMADISYSININSYSGFATVGHQFKPSSKFFIDLYVGFGLKYSFHNSPQNVSVEYNRDFTDYGYTGTQFLGGFRLGVAL